MSLLLPRALDDSPVGILANLAPREPYVGNYTACSVCGSKERIVAIGDVHGNYEVMLQVLHKAGVISSDNECSWNPTITSNNPVQLIQVGDIVDRGPAAPQAWRCLRDLQENSPTGSSVIRLIGNQIAAIRAKQETGDYVSEKEKSLLAESDKKVKNINDDPYRHKKGGPQGKGGGSNWDTWGDEDNWDGGDDDDKKSDKKGFPESKGRAPPSPDGPTEHKEDSYHAKNAKEVAGVGNNDSQFGSRKIGGFQVASPDQWATVRGKGSNIPAIAAAGGSFSHGSGPLARQNTMQSQGKALLRSPDKKAVTLDLSKVTAAPPSVKPPAPIKFEHTPADAIPMAPSNIPRPGSASTDGSRSRPSSVLDAPVAPRSIPIPAPRGSPGGFRPGSQGGSPGYRPGTGHRPNPQGSPDATLKFSSGPIGEDDDGGYSMDVRGSFDPLASMKKTLPRPTFTPSQGRVPPPSSGALAAVNSISAANRGFPGRGAPPRGAPPAYTAPIQDGSAGTRFMPPGTGAPAGGDITDEKRAWWSLCWTTTWFSCIPKGGTPTTKGWAT